jgi:hypothetical protein
MSVWINPFFFFMDCEISLLREESYQQDIDSLIYTMYNVFVSPKGNEYPLDGTTSKENITLI